MAIQDNHNGNSGTKLVKLPLRVNPETIEANGQVGKVRSVRIGSKHYPCIFVEVSEHDAHQYMQLEWADVKAEERSERCLIEDGHGGYIMCPESNKCINCPKVGSFNFDTNRPTSLDALYTESEFEPASSRIRLMKPRIFWRCWLRSLGGLSRNMLRSSKSSTKATSVR